MECSPFICLFLKLESSHSNDFLFDSKVLPNYPLAWKLGDVQFFITYSIFISNRNNTIHFSITLVGAIAFQAYYGDRDIIPVNIGEGSVVTFSDVPLNHGKG